MPTGNGLLYMDSSKPNAPSNLWLLPLQNDVPAGPAARLIQDLAPADSSNWAAGRDGIYYVRRAPNSSASMEFFDFRTRQVRSLYRLAKLPAYAGGIAVAPDGASLLFTQIDHDGSEIFIQ